MPTALPAIDAEEVGERAQRRRAEALARRVLLQPSRCIRGSVLTPMVGDTQKAVCTVPAIVIGADVVHRVERHRLAW